MDIWPFKIAKSLDGSTNELFHILRKFSNLFNLFLKFFFDE